MVRLRKKSNIKQKQKQRQSQVVNVNVNTTTKTKTKKTSKQSQKQPQRYPVFPPPIIIPSPNGFLSQIPTDRHVQESISDLRKTMMTLITQREPQNLVPAQQVAGPSGFLNDFNPESKEPLEPQHIQPSRIELPSIEEDNDSYTRSPGARASTASPFPRTEAQRRQDARLNAGKPPRGRPIKSSTTGK